MKFKYFFITTVVMAATFYSAVVFFSPGTLRWTGGMNTDWNTAANWTVVSGTPSIPPNKFSTGDHVIIDGTAPNFPEITVAAGARSLTVDANAIVTVKAGGSLEVIGSDVDGVTNSGLIIVESMATMLIDSAFDDGLINLAGAKVANAGTFTIQNGFGSRIENQDSIINTGTFNVNPGVDTAVINFNTGVIKNTGSFFILGGNSSQLANYGRVLNESNTFTVAGGTAGIIILNRLGALIQNAGTFSVQSGSDRRIDNEGTIINSSSFTVSGALLGEGIVNHVNGLITNAAGTFDVSGGTATRLDNYGTISNSATFDIDGASAGNGLINRAGAVVDNLAGTMDLSGGNATELDNYGIVNNYSIFNINGGSAGNNLLNRVGAVFNHFSGTWTAGSGNATRIDNSGLITIHATATFNGGGSGHGLHNTSTGEIEHISGLLTIQNFNAPSGFQNDGSYLGGSASSLTIPTGNGIGIWNTGSFIDSAGCMLDLHGLSGNLIQNEGLMYVDCIIDLCCTGGDGIHNTSTGVYRQNFGSIEFNSFGSDLIENDNYFYADVDMAEEAMFGGGTANYILNNKDSMILGPNSSLTIDGTTRFVFNSGLMDNAGEWTLSMSGNTIIDNSGTTFFRSTASLRGMNAGGHVITNTGRFYNDGFIYYRDFGPSLLFNTNYFNNSGTLQGGLFGGGLINQDTLINSGIIEIDTVGVNGLSNTGFFLNDTTGEFYADYIGQNGIFNDIAGIVKNNGAIWMARDTGISRFAILNLGQFDNCSLINIGQSGPLFGGGIHNSSGSFSNLTGGEIYIYHADTFGILNDNQFLNSCAYIETEGIIRDNSSFTNDGVIRKVIDTNDLASNIAVNNGIVINLDPDPFIITTNNGIAMGSGFAAQNIFVDATATGCGTGASWPNALLDLQDALAVANPGDTIRVAAGTYYPDTPVVGIPNRDLSFNIPDSVVVLGGYPVGGGTDEERDWVCNKTILCGDIGIPGDASDNSYHVVVTTNVDSTTVVDGFCITDGNADGTGNNQFGAGWFNDGGGEGNSTPLIRNTVITGNFASLGGGGLFNAGRFSGNSSPILINCIISGNATNGRGGGIFNAGDNGGNASPVLINCILSGNFAGIDGGGSYNVGGTCLPIFINVVIAGNYANGNGGAMYNRNSDPTLTNCIVWNNDVGNSGPDFYNFNDNANPQISYSIFERDYSSLNTNCSSCVSDNGFNKYNTNPQFYNSLPASSAPTPAGDFHVMSGSMAINMGDNASNTYPTDLDGMNRIAEGIIDIGPYEKLIHCDSDTIYVTDGGNIPAFPLDSILRDTIPEGFTLVVNGVPSVETDSLRFDCFNLGSNSFEILLIRNCDTIDGCTQLVFVVDSFPKNLVCNDLVNVSLGARCLKVVTTDDVLENVMGCREVLYDIELSYPLGTHKFPPTNDLLDESHIGYTMVYSVYETLTGNKCWGYLKVEDKLPPQLNCANDTIACYELPDLPLLAPNADDCYDGKVELISDEWFDYGCDSVLSGYVIRTIQGTDRWGNFRRCRSVISIERTVLDSVECPDVVELPCEIRTQIGGGKTLKTPIVVDQTKVTPAYLLSLQKRTWDFTDNTKDWILNPSVQVVPQIQGQNIYPGAAGICKISSTYKDTRLDVCGAGFKIYREWTIVDWCTQQDTICGQYIKVTDTEAPVVLVDLSELIYDASAHDCVAAVTIPPLVAGKDFRDCNMVDQTYYIEYDDPAHPGKLVVVTGTLPSTKLFLPVGEYKIVLTLVDKCQNRTLTSRLLRVHDITPPTPVCDEFTQVTLDPVTCWAKVKAKDLDNGSRDNCCDVLHFAAAHIDSITYWTKYWTDTLEARCGKAAFWADKEFYDFQIERWINAYVFKDEIKFDECGTSQVVLRVYEACGVPIYDPHVWPCTEHQWFWYNTDQRFRIEHNWNYFSASGPKDCNYRYKIQCIEDHQKRLRGICQFGNETPFPQPKVGGLCYAQYAGAVNALPELCEDEFYYPQSNSSEALAPGNRCSYRLYSDCMINVLVDDKQAPIVAELEDVVVYCDRAPESAYAPNCMGGEEFNVWPGLLKDKKGVEHGYYGGSDFLGIHRDEHETGDPCGYDNAHHWAPIYCRSWLYLDSFDSAGKIDPKQYFETLVLFDKTRATRTLLAKEFSITDNCRLNDTTLKMSDEGSLNGCGEGWIQRTWTIQDKCGNTVTAKQKVVVKHRSDFEVIFPEDKVVECDFLNTTDPKDAGEPIISDDECEQVGIQYKDEVFTIEDSACYKIVRTWTLIDWCIYNPNAQFHYSDVIVDDRLRADTGNRSCVYRHLKDNNDGYMKYIQVIKVIDKVAPTVTTRDTTICIYSEDCKSALVRIPFNATDNCTATSELSYRVEVDLNATSTVFTNRTYVKSSIDQTTQSNQIEFVYSPSVAGKHVVHVIVKDNCGNEDTSSYRFELVDCKKPTPYCYNGVATVIMPSNSKITVWAKDLDAGSLDNCTLAANLKFSFSSNSSETSKEFTCADIPDGKSKTIPVDIWVTDEAGNQDHCSTYILLQDNSGNVCPDVAGLSVTIAGKIQTETNEPVEHVRVNIYGGALQMNYQTGIKGTYHFEGLPSNSNYSLKSTRDDQPMNGVSTLDLVLIQKHILGIELLDSPYKILAADVDNDKQITAIDLVELRKLILATYEDLPNNESWRFIPKSTTFSDPQNPWNAGAVSEVLEMKEVTIDYKSEDFIGLKVGDVNATAAPHSLMGVEVRGNETGLLFEVTDQVFNRGDVVRVDFRSPNFRGISGWQGTLNISDQLSGISGQLISGSLSMTDQNMGMRFAKEGMITMSWNTNAKSGLDIDDQQVLFTLVFKAQENGKLSEVLRIGSQHTIAESYEGKGELGNLSIRFVQNGNEIVAKSELYQNYPNPFDQRTVIGINLASQGKGTLKVYDATGRTIKSVERDWTKGYHEVWFDRREIGSTGVLYYRFESGFFNASKKMIILD